MRSITIFVGSLALALFAGGCELVQMCPEEGEGGSGGDTESVEGGCAVPPAEGFGGTGGGHWKDDEYRDDEGICRSTREIPSSYCPPTYDLALAEPSFCGGDKCAATCGDWLVVHYVCQPAIGCSYDPLSRALVGLVYGNDIPGHCGETSYSVIYGDGHHSCQITDIVLNESCWKN